MAKPKAPVKKTAAKSAATTARKAPAKSPQRRTAPTASSRTLERAQLAPGTKSVLTPEMIAASQLTAEDREQQQRDATHDEIMARTLQNKVFGSGAMEVHDESDIPIVLGNFQGRSMEPVRASGEREQFLDAVPPGVRREPPLQSEPRSVVEDRLRQEMSAGESLMNDRFDNLAPEQPAFEQGRPEMMFHGVRPRSAEPDQPNKIDELNPVARIFGARLWRKGTGAVSWMPQTAFTYHFFEQGVIVDIFDPNVFRQHEAAVRDEVAKKAAAIERHNATADRPHGYIAFVMGYFAQPQEIEDVLAGTVYRTLRVGALPAAPIDTYDSVRAASGDPFAAAAARGDVFQADGWNRPPAGAQPARYAPASEAVA